MAIKKVLLGGQLIAVDDETGELQVSVSGIKFDKDIDIGDAHLLDKSDQKINPATSEDIAALTAAGLPFDLRAHLADTFVAISTTAGGATLATLKGAALEATTAFVRIVPQFTTDDIRFSLAGDPTSASPKVPASGLILNAAQAATVKLIAITVAANATLSEV